jgi:hypothetical protein
MGGSVLDFDLQGTAAVAALVTGLITYIRTSQREKSIRRADLVRGYTVEFYSDEALVTLFTDLDYSRFRFTADEESWLGKKPEQTVVKLLDLFNSVGHNWHRKVLGLEDVHGTTLGYAILRAYNDDEMQKYLAHVDVWDVDHLGTGIAFEYFRRLALALDERSKKFRAARLRDQTRAQLTPIPKSQDAEPSRGNDQR